MTDDELNERFNNLKTEVDRAVRAEGVATRHHFDVVAEGLRGEIRLIADGYDALRQDVVQLTAGQERIETRMDRLEIRQLALEDRQGKLEDRQGKLEEGHRGLVTEVRLLAARLPA